MMILPRSKCAILPIVLKGEWYDMIARGWKREEYRDSTPYWAVRLSNWDNTEASAHVVEFRRGYRSDAPRQAYICNIYTSTDEVPLPEGLDAVAALLYCDKAGIEVWEYRRHAEHCRELNLGASAWTPAPKRFRDFAEEVERRLAECRHRREAAAAKRQNAKLAARATELAALAVRVPRGVILLYPDSRKSLEDEGAAMHNCIGNGLYALEMARGASVCVFIRRAEAPDKPFCDAELSRKGGAWRVRQCYVAGNQPAPEDATKAARAVCAALNKAAKRKGA